MVFRVPLRTRATECAHDRWITLPAVISYMEHCRWEWMRVPSLGLLEAVHEGYGFYVLNQSIAMNRRFGMGQNVHVGCALSRVGRSSAEAFQSVVRKDDGVQLAHCHIRGAWVDPQGRLARISSKVRESVTKPDTVSDLGSPHPGSDISLFDPPEPPRSGQLDLQLPDAPLESGHRYSAVVSSSDTDIFNHVNAANYVRFVANALAAQGYSSSLHRAELKYIGQAVAGDHITVISQALGDNRFAADICRGEAVLFRSVVETEPNVADTAKLS